MNDGVEDGREGGKYYAGIETEDTRGGRDEGGREEGKGGVEGGRRKKARQIHIHVCRQHHTTSHYVTPAWQRKSLPVVCPPQQSLVAPPLLSTCRGRRGHEWACGRGHINNNA